jgi:hypothetical protein
VNTGFPDLLATESEKFAKYPKLLLDDLFADITDSNSPRTYSSLLLKKPPKLESNDRNVASVLSNQEELDFFSMWDDEEVSNV